MFLRTSERNLFKRCQWAWQRNYLDLYTPLNHQKALWVGSGIHAALEHYYVIGRERGPHPTITFNAWIDRHGDDFPEDELAEARELGTAMLDGYVNHYGAEPHLEVIAVEKPFNVGINYQHWHPTQNGEANTTQEQARYVGKVDLVVRDHERNKIFLWDHKTTARLGSAHTQYLQLDDQAGAYWAVADAVLRHEGLIDKTEGISGIMFNYLVKQKPNLSPRNPDGLVCNQPQKKHYFAALEAKGVELDPKTTLQQLKELASKYELTVLGDPSAIQPPPLFDRKFAYRRFRERQTQINRIQVDLEAMSLVRSGVVPATKTPTRECGFCSFKTLCELDEAGRDWHNLVDMSYTRWDPYEDHRKDK